MTGTDLDDCVRALLEIRLDSFEKLEVVCAIYARGQAMSRHELEVACLLPSELLRETLLDLEQLELIALDGEQQVRLHDRSLRLGIAALAQCYAEDRVGVLSKLSSVAIQRIRRMAAKAFADALVSHHKRGADD